VARIEYIYTMESGSPVAVVVDGWGCRLTRASLRALDEETLRTILSECDHATAAYWSVLGALYDVVEGDMPKRERDAILAGAYEVRRCLVCGKPARGHHPTCSYECEVKRRSRLRTPTPAAPSCPDCGLSGVRTASDCPACTARRIRLGAQQGSLKTIQDRLCPTCGYPSEIPGELCWNCTLLSPITPNEAKHLLHKARRAGADTSAWPWSEVAELADGADLPGLKDAARQVLAAAQAHIPPPQPMQAGDGWCGDCGAKVAAGVPYCANCTATRMVPRAAAPGPYKVPPCTQPHDYGIPSDPGRFCINCGRPRSSC
jgi:hypothetical protein